jgi:hypothetical protein
MSKPLCVVAAIATLIAAHAPAVAETGWQSKNFPPPNGGFLVYFITSAGNPACASYNGRDCLWGQQFSQINFDKVRPLICGDEHRAKWGVTGYENPKHWCNLAKPVSQSKPGRFD